MLMPEDGSIYYTSQTLTCTIVTSTNGNYFMITSVELKGSSYSNHTIVISSVTNPSAGGTGYFKIETRRGNLNLLDYNHYFETVGIVGNPQPITVYSFSRTQNSVNAISDYTFSIKTISLLPNNGSVVFTFNSGGLQFTSSSTCTTSISALATCAFSSSLQIVTFSVKKYIFYNFNFFSLILIFENCKILRIFNKIISRALIRLLSQKFNTQVMHMRLRALQLQE